MSFLGSASGVGRAGRALLQHRVIAATAGAATAVLVVGCAFAATSSSGHETLANVSNNGPATTQHVTTKTKPKAAPVVPLKVISVTPASGAHDANGAAPITVKFSTALSPQTPLPTLSPSVKGSWQVSGDTATFTPATGFMPDTTVRVTVPGGTDGMLSGSASAQTLAKSSVTSFRTGSYSTLRLQQLLAQLGYLPLTWTPSDPSTPAIAGPTRTPSSPRPTTRPRARSPSTPATPAR